MALLKNIIPRILIFMLKDIFSDFEGLKVLVLAREEGIKLISELQRLAELNPLKGGVPEIKPDMLTLVKMMPKVFQAVAKDTWFT